VPSFFYREALPWRRDDRQTLSRLAFGSGKAPGSGWYRRPEAWDSINRELSERLERSLEAETTRGLEAVAADLVTVWGACAGARARLPTEVCPHTSGELVRGLSE